MKEPSDDELVQRCRQGDSLAFEALVARYQRKVLGLCLRHLRSYEEACDMAQEVFVQVFQHLPDFQGKSSFSTWLYRVCLNACYNRQRYWRAKGRGGVTSLEGLLEARETGADTSALMRSKDAGALVELERNEDVAGAGQLGRKPAPRGRAGGHRGAQLREGRPSAGRAGEHGAIQAQPGPPTA
jgi:RNA polymerase sigma factor (sigma-70 family)